MHLSVRHRTIYSYQNPVKRVSLLLRLRPCTFDGQQVLDWHVRVNGEDVRDFATNSRGDEEAHVKLDHISQLEIEAEGLVSVEDRNGVVMGFARKAPRKVYLRETPLTAPDDAIRALAQSVGGGGDIARLHSLATKAQNALIYTKGATNEDTTAAQALAQGRGVCQDHAHLFVSAARTLGIPARYVVGYFLASADQDALHETHGWAEAWVDGLGWVGFDVTNGICVSEHHIRLCCGMDAHDAAPVRGAVLGQTQIEIDADVLIGEAELSALAQIQQQQ